MSRRDVTKAGLAASAAGLMGQAFGQTPTKLQPGVDVHEIARRHIEEIWAGGNEEVAWEMYAEDVVDHNPAPDQRPGIPGIIDVLRWLRESVPDLSMSIESYVVEGNYGSDRWVMTGTHIGAPLMGIEARDKAFRIHGMDVIRVRSDGKITDVWHVEEFHSLLMQIQAP